MRGGRHILCWVLQKDLSQSFLRDPTECLSPLIWRRKQINFPEYCVCWHLKFRTTDKVQKTIDSERHITPSEHFRFSLFLTCSQGSATVPRSQATEHNRHSPYTLRFPNNCPSSDSHKMKFCKIGYKSACMLHVQQLSTLSDRLNLTITDVV
jgi:hypothetical protein